jgi:hypothetical protein
MSARLQELLRQKALLDEQAAWLAREIATEQARTGASPAPIVPPPAAASVSSPGPAAPTDRLPPSLDAEAESIIDRYRDSAQTAQQRVKRGCILYFIGALALIALGVLAIHFMAHRR